MFNLKREEKFFLYNVTCHETERSLCELEMRSLFGQNINFGVLESSIKINPSRSPFISNRIAVIFESKSLDEIIKQLKGLNLLEQSFKVVFVQYQGIDEKVGFKKRRLIEREVGINIQGAADLLNPKIIFAITKVNGRWVFGEFIENEAIWLHHQNKPHSYSTALSTRVARAIVNIAVPNPAGVTVIDPCCGIGTVLVEALSMGIDIVGSDNNPLVMAGVRENIAQFGYRTEVSLKDIRNVEESFDVAIIDMPYNLCSVISPEEQLEMLQSARNFANRVVIVTVETIDTIIENAGFSIVDRAIVTKGRFIRQVLVCEKE